MLLYARTVIWVERVLTPFCHLSAPLTCVCEALAVAVMQGVVTSYHACSSSAAVTVAASATHTLMCGGEAPLGGADKEAGRAAEGAEVGTAEVGA